MNISYKWLKRYIDFSLSPKELTAASNIEIAIIHL